MAFTQSSFSPVGANSTVSPAVYSYSTDDSLAVVIATDYFVDKSFQLEESDILFVSASDGFSILEVSSSTATASPIASPGTPSTPIAGDTTITESSGSFDVDASSGDVTMSLPALSAPQSYTFRKLNSVGGNVIIEADGVETINGELNMTLTGLNNPAVNVYSASIEWGIK